jgi:hypothetical protein
MLGKGGFGEVAVYIDTKTNKRYACKKFLDFDGWKEERTAIERLEKVLGANTKEVCAMMEKYDPDS